MTTKPRGGFTLKKTITLEDIEDGGKDMTKENLGKFVKVLYQDAVNKKKTITEGSATKVSQQRKENLVEFIGKYMDILGYKSVTLPQDVFENLKTKKKGKGPGTRESNRENKRIVLAAYVKGRKALMDIGRDGQNLFLRNMGYRHRTALTNKEQRVDAITKVIKSNFDKTIYNSASLETGELAPYTQLQKADLDEFVRQYRSSAIGSKVEVNQLPDTKGFITYYANSLPETADIELSDHYLGNKKLNTREVSEYQRMTDTNFDRIKTNKERLNEVKKEAKKTRKEIRAGLTDDISRAEEKGSLYDLLKNALGKQFHMDKDKRKTISSIKSKYKEVMAKENRVDKEDVKWNATEIMVLIDPGDISLKSAKTIYTQTTQQIKADIRKDINAAKKRDLERLKKDLSDEKNRLKKDGEYDDETAQKLVETYSKQANNINEDADREYHKEIKESNEIEEAHVEALKLLKKIAQRHKVDAVREFADEYFGQMHKGYEQKTRYQLYTDIKKFLKKHPTDEGRAKLKKDKVILELSGKYNPDVHDKQILHQAALIYRVPLKGTVDGKMTTKDEGTIFNEIKQEVRNVDGATGSVNLNKKKEEIISKWTDWLKNDVDTFLTAGEARKLYAEIRGHPTDKEELKFGQIINVTGEKGRGRRKLIRDDFKYLARILGVSQTGQVNELVEAVIQRLRERSSTAVVSPPCDVDEGFITIFDHSTFPKSKLDSKLRSVGLSTVGSTVQKRNNLLVEGFIRLATLVLPVKVSTKDRKKIAVRGHVIDFIEGNVEKLAPGTKMAVITMMARYNPGFSGYSSVDEFESDNGEVGSALRALINLDEENIEGEQQDF